MPTCPNVQKPPIGREVRGALCRPRDKASRLYRSVSRSHPMGSKPLRTILEGHHADSISSCLQQSMQAAQRTHKFGRLRWRDSPSLAGWQHAVVDGLSKYGWQPLQNWVLQCTNFGSRGVAFSLSSFCPTTGGTAICCKGRCCMVPNHANKLGLCMKVLAITAEQCLLEQRGPRQFIAGLGIVQGFKAFDLLVCL